MDLVMKSLVPSLWEPYRMFQRAVWSEFTFLTGPPSTGKTTMVKRFFEAKEKEYLHAFIDCYSIKNQGQLLSKVCDAFHSTLNVRRNRSAKATQNLPEPGVPVPLNDFYAAMKEYITIALSKGYRRFYIVFDQVEVFDKTNLVDTLVALARHNIHDIRLIVISCEHPNDFFHCISQKSSPIALSLQDRCQVVVCSAWSREDIVNWVVEVPPKEGIEMYKKFVKNVVSLVTSTESKDPMMIRMYCQEHFGDFIAYYKQKRKEQVLKQLKLDPNSDELTDEDLDKFEQEVGINNNLLVSTFLQSFKLLVRSNKDNSKWTSDDKETHLTKNVAILITAAYIAAHTTLSDDKSNFIRYQRKKSKSTKKGAAERDHGSKPFTLERLVQIYFELIKKSTGDQTLNFIENNDSILGDIERLKNLGILHHQSGFQFCSEARYKLSDNVKGQFVNRIAGNNDLHLPAFVGLRESFSANT